MTQRIIPGFAGICLAAGLISSAATAATLDFQLLTWNDTDATAALPSAVGRKPSSTMPTPGDWLVFTEDDAVLAGANNPAGAVSHNFVDITGAGGPGFDLAPSLSGALPADERPLNAYLSVHTVFRSPADKGEPLWWFDTANYQARATCYELYGSSYFYASGYNRMGGAVSPMGIAKFVGLESSFGPFAAQPLQLGESLSTSHYQQPPRTMVQAGPRAALGECRLSGWARRVRARVRLRSTIRRCIHPAQRGPSLLLNPPNEPLGRHRRPARGRRHLGMAIPPGNRTD
jgi:hypothetical protein